MPTIFYIDGFRFFFYSNEHLPKHIHIEKAEKTAKINLENVELVKSLGFNASELKQICNFESCRALGAPAAPSGGDHSEP